LSFASSVRAVAVSLSRFMFGSFERRTAPAACARSQDPGALRATRPLGMALAAAHGPCGREALPLREDRRHRNYEGLPCNSE